MTPRKWVPVLHAGDPWYEAWHVGDPVGGQARRPILHGLQRHLQGSYPAGAAIRPSHGPMRDGAISEDGLHWEKTETTAVDSRPERRPIPKPEPDRIGDSTGPRLRWDDGRWRLGFDYWLPGQGICMGYAENRGDFAARPNGFISSHDLSRPLAG